MDRNLSRTEYFDKLETVAHYVARLRERRPSPALDAAPGIIKEMQFVGMFSHKYREQTCAGIESLLDDIYIELAQ